MRVALLNNGNRNQFKRWRHRVARAIANYVRTPVARCGNTPRIGAPDSADGRAKRLPVYGALQAGAGAGGRTAYGSGGVHSAADPTVADIGLRVCGLL